MKLLHKILPYVAVASALAVLAKNTFFSSIGPVLVFFLSTWSFLHYYRFTKSAMAPTDFNQLSKPTQLIFKLMYLSFCIGIMGVLFAEMHWPMPNMFLFAGLAGIVAFAALWFNSQRRIIFSRMDILELLVAQLLILSTIFMN
ncbi:hypothetical protein GC194_01405 [bacterium]|nr:hypothetical protein [bacterium]